MPQSSHYRVKTAVAVTVGGMAATALLAATMLDPSPTQVSAPHSIVDEPEFSGAKQVTDSFYTPTKAPPGMAPGTLITSEPIPGAPPGINARRIMYTSQTAGGEVSVVTGMYAVREGPAGPNGRPLITLGHGTTGIAPGCGISQAPFTPQSTGAGTWSMMTSGLVGAGFAVVATDYANLGVPETPDYLVMEGEGHDVLNAARAAFELDPAGLDRTKVGIMGHSQGGHAALSAAYIAPSYAPDLSIKGTVAVAPAIFPPAPALIKFITADPDDTNSGYFLSFIADAMISWEANYPGRIKVSDVFSPAGVQAAEVAKTKCLDATSKAFAGRKGDFVNEDIPSSILAVAKENFPIYEKYATPLLIQQGMEDTTVVPGVNIGAARTMCLQGTNLKLQTYPTDVHSSILYTGLPQALDWLNERFAGLPAESDCRGL